VVQRGEMQEVPLPGGFASTVTRVGDTVRRSPSGRAGFVHELLELFGCPVCRAEATGQHSLQHLGRRRDHPGEGHP
jgi:hypothetical protein